MNHKKLTNQELEQLVEENVKTFVTSLNGRYRDHCSDSFLTAILMHRLVRTFYNETYFNRAVAWMNGDPNATYSAAQPIFENMLEHGCHVICNGHHVAQNFGEFMDGVLEEKFRNKS